MIASIPRLQSALSFSWVRLWFIRGFPKYLNCFTLIEGLLPIFKLPDDDVDGDDSCRVTLWPEPLYRPLWPWFVRLNLVACWLAFLHRHAVHFHSCHIELSVRERRWRRYVTDKGRARNINRFEKKIKVYEYFGHLATDEMIIMNLKQMLRVFGQEHGLVAGTEIRPWIP